MNMKERDDLKWNVIGNYDIQEYQCGLKAGDEVRLRSELVIRDHEGHPTGEVHTAGEVWAVLPGADEDPGVVWLRQPDESRHTWPDNNSIYETFEVLSKP